MHVDAAPFRHLQHRPREDLPVGSHNKDIGGKGRKPLHRGFVAEGLGLIRLDTKFERSLLHLREMHAPSPARWTIRLADRCDDRIAGTMERPERRDCKFGRSHEDNAHIPGGHIIQDEGVSLPNRAALDFIGTNVRAIDNPGGNKTDIIISGTAGTGGGSLPDMQVGYGDGSAIVGNSNFLFDDTNELLSIGTANLTNLHDGAATLALVQEGASRPVINLDYYGSSGYPRIQFSSASGVATALGSVASGRVLMEVSAYGFITGSSAARWREGFEFFVYTNNPWTITGAASARAEFYIKSIAEKFCFWCHSNNVDDQRKDRLRYTSGRSPRACLR